MSNEDNTLRSLFSLKVMLPLALLGIGAVTAWIIIETAPKATRRPPAAFKPIVEIMTLERRIHRIWVPVMGTVTAARRVTLRARVSGDVTTVSPSFVPGGFFKRGQRVLTIDSEDYELTLEQVRSEVADAEYDLRIESGHQAVSAREWDLLKGSDKAKEGDAELALRKPHLERAKAGLEAARAKLRKAELDLARTRITAPFAAMVEEKNVDIGASISTQDALAMLVGTDEFWIEASVPVDRLSWIDIPSGDRAVGSLVHIGSGESVREGRVIRLLPSLESEGRMARLLISIEDPLNLAGREGVEPLLLGSYVSLKIDGGVLENVYSIPRLALRDNNQVWLMSAKGTLDIRTVTPIWREAEAILFEEGFEAGDRLVLSDIGAPLMGMEIQTAEEAIREKADKGGRRKQGAGQ